MTFSSLFYMAIEALSPVLLAVLTWAGAKVVTWIQANVNNSYLRNTLVRVDDAVVTAVKELQQTIVDEIKAANADGNIDDTESERIKSMALANVKSYLGTKGLLMVGKVLGLVGDTLDRYLGSRIEATVHDLRTTTKAVAGSQASPVTTHPLAASPA